MSKVLALAPMRNTASHKSNKYWSSSQTISHYQPWTQLCYTRFDGRSSCSSVKNFIIWRKNRHQEWHIREFASSKF